MRLQKLSETLKLHHTEPRDSSTYLSVFTGRLQWQTIVTLTLHLVDWSIYKQNVISNCVVRRSVVVTFKSWDHSAVHLCLSVQLWRLSCWTERVSTIHYFSNKQKSNTEITQAFCRGEPGWRKLPHWPTKNTSSLHRSIDEAIIRIQKYLWINENEKKHCLKLERWQGPPHVIKVKLRTRCPSRSVCMFSLFSREYKEFVSAIKFQSTNLSLVHL